MFTNQIKAGVFSNMMSYPVYLHFTRDTLKFDGLTDASLGHLLASRMASSLDLPSAPTGAEMIAWQILFSIR